ncbi:hypothetical protein GCM10028857_25290 [Salinarchaeum chitinilyticum]
MSELREITSDEEWERGAAILRQLWSHVDESFVSAWREEDDYRLLGWYVGDPGGGGATSAEEPLADGSSNATLVAVAGVYVQTVLHHERSLWVHDLVVDEAYRRQGHGEALLAELEQWGEARGCDHFALVCSEDNDAAAEFYEDAGMEPFGTVYELGI